MYIRDFSRNFSKGVKINWKARSSVWGLHHALHATNIAGLTVEVCQYHNMFTLVWMWAAAVYICMCSMQILKGGRQPWRGERFPPPLALCRTKHYSTKALAHWTISCLELSCLRNLQDDIQHAVMKLGMNWSTGNHKHHTWRVAFAINFGQLDKPHADRWVSKNY